MKLTSFTDYSMRVLLHAASKNDELSSIREVSEAYDISSNHLMKVVHHLGKGGYLETIRGKNGGFKLGMKPENIIIGKVIRYTEEDLEIVAGMSENSDQLGGASFASIMSDALDAFFDVADGYTLADLIENPQLMSVDVAS